MAQGLLTSHFKGLMGQFGLSSRWLKMSSKEKSRAILLLLDHLELWDREERLRGARAVLYLAQVGNEPTLVFTITLKTLFH